MIHVRLAADDFDPADEMEAMGAAGAVVSFTGHVRGDDGVAALYLEHHPRMTEPALVALAEQAMARWPVTNVRLIHRVGELEVGARIVFVGVAGDHRDAAFEAARYLIDRLKTDVPLWKRETLTDGTCRWVEQKVRDLARAESWKDQPSR